MDIRVELAPQILDDFERIIEHLDRYQVEKPMQRIEEIITAFDTLKTSPHLGRPKEGGKRELIIGEKSRGYIALYRYIEEIKTVFILAIRSQRETGYS